MEPTSLPYSRIFVKMDMDGCVVYFTRTVKHKPVGNCAGTRTYPRLVLNYEK